LVINIQTNNFILILSSVSIILSIPCRSSAVQYCQFKPCGTQNIWTSWLITYTLVVNYLFNNFLQDLEKNYPVLQNMTCLPHIGFKKWEDIVTVLGHVDMHVSVIEAPQ